MGSVIFDTNILIDSLRGIARAADELKRRPEPAISFVTWMEILAGGTEANAPALRDFLDDFEIIGLDDDIKEAAVAIRRTQRLKLPDAIILATAQVRGMTLVTRNTKDFRPDAPGIRIPYAI